MTIRDRQLAWLDYVSARTGLNFKEMARKAGLGANTLYNFVDGTHNMSPRTVEALVTTYRVRRPEEFEGPAGFGEPEAVQYAGPEADALYRHMQPNRTTHPWRIDTKALDMEGIHPGDALWFDQSIRPRPGDVVIAQVYDRPLSAGLPGSALTVIRLYRPPYLVARSTDPAFSQPVLIDDKVEIRGVMVHLARTRAAG